VSMRAVLFVFILAAAVEGSSFLSPRHSDPGTLVVGMDRADVHNRRQTLDNSVCKEQTLADWMTEQLAAVTQMTSELAEGLQQMGTDLAIMLVEHAPGLQSVLTYIDLDGFAFGSKTSDVAMDALVDHHLAHIKDLQEKDGGVESGDGDFEEDEEVQVIRSTDFHRGHQIGSGGFKTVYKGTYFGQDVAVGIMTPDSGSFSTAEVHNIEAEIAVQEEVRDTLIAGRPLCRHFIPRIIGKNVRKNGSGHVTVYMLIMELGQGDMDERSYSADPYASQAVALMMMYGLKCTHAAGYIHKDIKPLNYLLSQNGMRVLTSDYGLARKTTSSRLGRREGTRVYMPTESADRSTERYDVYAAGISMSTTRRSSWYLGCRLSGLPSGLLSSMTASSYTDRPSVDRVIKLLVDNALKTQMAALEKARNEVRSEMARLQELDQEVLRARARVAELRREQASLREAPQKDEDEPWGFMFLFCGDRGKGGRATELDKVQHHLQLATENSDNVRRARAAADGKVSEANRALQNVRQAVTTMHSTLSFQGGDPSGLLDTLMSGRPLPTLRVVA